MREKLKYAKTHVHKVDDSEQGKWFWMNIPDLLTGNYDIYCHSEEK